MRRWGEKAAKYQKHAHIGISLMFGVRAVVRELLDIKTCP